MKAIIYCRVSTKEQAEQGYSLEGQEKECKRFAQDKGYEIDRVFIERGESAKTQNRTELQKLVKYCIEKRKQLSALVIWKYDRLTRNLSDQMELVKTFSSFDIRVLSATENNEDSSIGKLMRNIIGSFSQFENDIRAERTINGMKQALLQGRWCWHAPLGYKLAKDDKNKTILVPSENNKQVAKAFQMAELGTYKQSEIVEYLKKNNLTITKSTLNRILRNPLYAGLIKVSWHSDYIEAIHKPTISKEAFFKVQLILSGKRPSIAPKLRNHPDFPLRNFVKCSACGKKLTGSWSTGRKKVKYAYYHCRTKGCSLNVKKEALDAKFYELLRSIQPNADVLALFEAIILDVWKNKQAEQIKEEYRLEMELNALSKKKDRIDELMIKGTFDDATYKKKIEEMNSEIIIKRTELNEAKIELNDAEACLNYCKSFLSNLSNLWVNAPLDLKQRFQSLVFPEGIAFDGEKFGTANISLIFKELSSENIAKSSLVALTGVEPVFTP